MCRNGTFSKGSKIINSHLRTLMWCSTKTRSGIFVTWNLHSKFTMWSVVIFFLFIQIAKSLRNMVGILSTTSWFKGVISFWWCGLQTEQIRFSLKRQSTQTWCAQLSVSNTSWLGSIILLQRQQDFDSITSGISSDSSSYGFGSSPKTWN